MQIDHIQLAAPPGCEPRVREFFVDILGMVELEKPAALRSRGGCWFRRGECSVHIGVDPHFIPQEKAHPAFRVAAAAELADRLVEAGFEVEWDFNIPGVSRFYSRDPFGNRLEFIDAGQGADGRETV